MSISTVTSEALQAKLRELLPSQQGFSTDISASDTIIPIIDLTAAAEGSSVGVNLQTALAFGSQTAFNTTDTTTALASTPGFYRVIGSYSLFNRNVEVRFDMTDGSTTKEVFKQFMENNSGSTEVYITSIFDFTFFVATGITLNAVSNSSNGVICGSIRQIADSNGVLVNPSGFTPQ
tara:strand:- start:150 stop:680 length:531 start_codon:yes stop_codon:yes gene_type:complete